MNKVRQKSRVVRILCGDDNTAFFHKHVNHRKNINSIWNIQNDDGIQVEGFESISKVGVQHFETLFQEEKNLHIMEIMKIVEHYPTSISMEENEDLMQPATLVEI